jgi:hypothetical protein
VLCESTQPAADFEESCFSGLGMGMTDHLSKSRQGSRTIGRCSASQKKSENKATFLQGSGRVYSVFAKLGNGEYLFVASREQLEKAAQLAQERSAN